ncbi:MAG: hypothetical protein KKD73_11160 [Proteobacteria bacterium]|nr:hypothetical protein [Pseudomonadota bacterium]MBU1641239.1 hypothetical protein [Pseudomonadota bacterium]
MTNEPTLQATEEQLLYANLLGKGMLIGLAMMFVTFALYVFGIIKPVVPLDQVASMWTQPVHEYLVSVNENFLHGDHLITGWAWMPLLGKGDFLNFMPIALLSGITIVCYAVITPGLFRRGDKAMAIMAVAEVLILSLAASGLLAVGH